MHRNLRVALAAGVVCLLPSVAFGGFIDLSAGGLGMSKSNVGLSFDVDGNLTLTAVTKLGQPGGGLAGTIYVNDKGIGVQNEIADGSKGISGEGPDGDELLRFTYNTPVAGDTLDLHLLGVAVNSGGFNNEVMQIELFFAGAPSVVRNNADVFAAYTETGQNDGFVDFSLLDGIGGAGGLTGFEFRVYEGHVLVSGV